MKVLAGGNRRGPVASSAFFLGALTVLSLTVFTNSKPQYVAPIVGFLVFGVVTWRKLLTWRSLLTITILLILFIPIKRYTIPSALPFQLEPYRIFIAFAALGWIASLLVDPRVQLRKSGIEAPILLFALAIALSLVANPNRVSSDESLVNSQVNKTLIFFLSFYIVFYLTVSSVHRLADINFVVSWLVGGGAVLAILALIERRTNYNIFNHLSSFLPLELNREGVPNLALRGGRLRVAASAQHPIALGAAFALLVPLAVYAAHARKQLRWWLAAVVIALGMFSTGSRTAVMMILVVALVFAWLRPRAMKRVWPALVPMLVLIHVVVPGALGTVKSSFFPKGGLIAEQQNAPAGHARLSTFGPALSGEWKPHPFLGIGFGTRVPTNVVSGKGENAQVLGGNARILDDQWLGVLIETGLFGALAFGWIFVRFIRRAGRAAKEDQSERGWLLVALVSSVAAYGVGMFTYDSFAFIQVTFLLFIILGLGCAAWQATPELEPLAGADEGPELVPRPRPPRSPRQSGGPARSARRALAPR